MIKTDPQLERTKQRIEGFRIQLKNAQELDDPTERELANASYQGMISLLQLEVERYELAKKGIVHMP